MTRKDKILQAALQLFVENGIENTSTAKIATSAGVATGTLFHHFKNKDDLINALYLQVKSSIAQVMSSGLDEPGDFKTLCKISWKNFIAWSIENPQLFQFNEQFCGSPLITKTTKQQIARDSFRFLYDSIQECQRQGVLRDLPAEYLSSIGSGIMISTAHYFMEHPEAFQDEGMVSQAFESFWDMLAAS